MRRLRSVIQQGRIYFLFFLRTPLSLLGGILLVYGSLQAQPYYRLKADFSIKEQQDTSYNLIMGKVYYDKRVQKLVYDIYFPLEQTWVMTDTLLYQFEQNELQGRQNVSRLLQFTIFHLSLNQNLAHYGFESEGPLHITDVEKNGDKVITTWSPPAKYQDRIGNILMSQQDKRLTGVIFLDKDQKALSKQFFENYKTVDGLAFPTRLVQIYYRKPPHPTSQQVKSDTAAYKRKEYYKVTTFENIVINEKGNKQYYNYPLPAH